MYNTTYLSSSIDWCEDNFVVDRYIVEFWNAYSSIIITLCGYMGMYYYYSDMFWLYLTLIPIGLSSYYFHSTLSLMGQMMDELSINFALIITLFYVNTRVKIFNPHILLMVIICQFISMFIIPQYNRLLLFIYGFYFWILIRTLKNSNEKIKQQINQAEILFVLSVLCWILDYMCIPILYSLYLHSIWHILIGLTGYYAFKSIHLYQKIE